MASVSVAPRSQRIHSSPHYQRYYSVAFPKIEEELENAITQTITDDDITRTPSANAVHEYIRTVEQSMRLRRFMFDDPSNVWIVTHNYNTNIFQETVFDSNHQKMIAPITIIDNNSFSIHLTEPLTGYVDVRF